MRFRTCIKRRRADYVNPDGRCFYPTGMPDWKHPCFKRRRADYVNPDGRCFYPTGMPDWKHRHRRTDNQTIPKKYFEQINAMTLFRERSRTESDR